VSTLSVVRNGPPKRPNPSLKLSRIGDKLRTMSGSAISVGTDGVPLEDYQGQLHCNLEKRSLCGG
jgi:hypothetical protein